MNVLGFEPTSVSSFSSSTDSRRAFDDVTIDNETLLPHFNRITESTHDIVTMLLPQRPDLAVEWIHGLIQPAAYDDEHLGRNEMLLYICPIDYDLLCGGFAMTVTLTPQTVRWSHFRYISTAEDAVAEYTTLLSSLSYEFQRAEYDTTLIKTLEKYRKIDVLQ